MGEEQLQKTQEMVTQLHTEAYRRQLDSNQARLMELVPIASKETGPSSLSEKLALRLPLSHATGAATFLKIIQSGSLLSYPKLIEEGLLQPPDETSTSVESVLETEDFIFTYAAPFRYPMTDCGFLFKTEVEQEAGSRGVATPFDSGATLRYLRPDDSKKDQISFLRAHELPVPEYRAFLESLIAHFFSSPWDYIEGRDPSRSWPIKVESGDWRRWTFEVRFRDELALAGNLQAVFVASDIASQDKALGQLVQWEAEGVDIVVYLRSGQGNSWTALRQESTEYLKRLLA